MSEMNEETISYTFEKWDDININRKLLRGIYAYGFEEPSPIQKKSIIPLIKKHDIIGQAQSGTGKTGAFSVGALERINTKNNTTQVIILSPTHELAIQNLHVCQSLGQFMNLRSHLLVGGKSIDDDKTILLDDNKPHLVVGCPGRVHDMLRRGWLSAKDVDLIILDEADEMLSMCFKEQIYNIFQFINSTVQVGLFSATMPDDVRLLTEKFMRNPISILVNSEMLTLEGLSQFYIALLDDQQKYLTLKDLFQNLTLSQTIIYCNSIKRVQDLTEAMNQDGFPVIAIHSSMSHDERSRTISDFKSGKYRVLISSDVTARGIDIQQVSIVINFDVCKNKHTYLHRIGRSARWGRKGIAINFVTRRDYSLMKEIETWYNTKIDELPTNYSDLIRTC